MIVKIKLTISYLLISLIFFGCSSPIKNDWKSVTAPSSVKSQVFGSYSAGCLDGAVSLAASSQSYQVMRLSRRRYFGHPDLVDFINHFSQDVFERKLGTLAVGDLSQPRGGPISGGHSSHQLGLDADIWFFRFSEKERNGLSLLDTESMSAISMVNDDGLTINQENWHSNNESVLEMAASHPEVERIFVNFVVKKHLCKMHKGESWLRKIRPWWGHTYHFHVRLACPEDSRECKQQKPVLQNDGCDKTLDWWFSGDSTKTFSKNNIAWTKSKASKTQPSNIKLPMQCAAVFSR